MKKLDLSIKILMVSITNLLALACSDDDPRPSCFQDQNRSIVATIDSINGVVRLVCDNIYAIDPDTAIDSSPVGLLAPCNLTNEFQAADIRVMFSGYVYESFENEDICADFFEITEIKLIEQ